MKSFLRNLLRNVFGPAPVAVDDAVAQLTHIESRLTATYEAQQEIASHHRTAAFQAEGARHDEVEECLVDGDARGGGLDFDESRLLDFGERSLQRRLQLRVSRDLLQLERIDREFEERSVRREEREEELRGEIDDTTRADALRRGSVVSTRSRTGGRDEERERERRGVTRFLEKGFTAETVESQEEREVSHFVTKQKEQVGVIYLEQAPAETAKRIAGKVAQKAFHVPDAGWNPSPISEAVAKRTNGVPQS